MLARRLRAGGESDSHGRRAPPPANTLTDNGTVISSHPKSERGQHGAALAG